MMFVRDQTEDRNAPGLTELRAAEGDGHCRGRRRKVSGMATSSCAGPPSNGKCAATIRGNRQSKSERRQSPAGR